MYKVRKIVSRKNDVYGITIPKEIAIRSENITFSIEMSGTSLIFNSGSNKTYTKEEIENYKFNEVNL